MKSSLLFFAILFSQSAYSYSQQLGNTPAREFKIVTVVESIVPMGIGRSRIIDSKTQVDASEFATARVDGTTSSQKEISRVNIKIDELEETKLLNFFSATGINFQNIASNDAMISSKINSMLSDGWDLTYVTSGVESSAGVEDGQGIYITRLFFSRNQSQE
jgi:hypothetical protein